MLTLLTLVAVLQASPQSSTAPSPVPTASAAASAASTEDPATTKVAKQELAAWQAGKPDWSHYAQSIPDATVAKVHTFLSSLGTVSSVTFLQKVQPQGAPVPVSVYLVKGANANAYLIIHVNDAGKVDGIFFKPAQ